MQSLKYISHRLFIIFFILFIVTSCKEKDIKSYAQYDETKIEAYTLPNPLICEDGTPVTSDSIWFNKRRPELIQLFGEHIYGHTPQRNMDTLIFRIHKINEMALGGKAIMKEVDVFFTNNIDSNSMRLLLVIPKNKKVSPCFVGLNFYGNMGISNDTSISFNNRWIGEKEGVVNHKATEALRGVNSRRWPLEFIIDRGYAVASIYYGDIDPDYDDGFQNGIHPLFYRQGQTKPDSNQWGSIGAWSWGLSRAVDYLISDSAIDATKIISIGHSRLGKTSLWAGAQDTRIAMVISNNSGCGGAALSKRVIGENVFIINTIFPHWFCDNFNKYNWNEKALPIDQHQLIALIAPRPVYIASASEDAWADPKGEFLAAVNADTVYRFLNKEGFPVKEMPELNQSVFGTIGYHIRKGEHDINTFDWEQYLNFADYHFKSGSANKQ